MERGLLSRFCIAEIYFRVATGSRHYTKPSFYSSKKAAPTRIIRVLAANFHATGNEPCDLSGALGAGELVQAFLCHLKKRLLGNGFDDAEACGEKLIP